jgi:hypothetical protein
MNIIKCTATTLAVLLTSIGAAHAQQTFEDRYVAPRPVAGELVALPTVGIVPTGAVPLDPDVAAQLSEAVQKELVSSDENRLEVLTRPSGGKTGWAFVVRNAPRAMHDAFTLQFTDQLITCLHSVPESPELAALNVLLVGSPLDNQDERDQANAAGAQMLANWRADRCATRRNNLPFFENNRPRITAATRGMLTDVFDPLLFRGQALLDLIRALSPVFYDPGAFWVVEMTPRLQRVFNAAVRSGLLTTAEANAVSGEQKTFWDWVIDVVSIKNTVVHSFIAHAAGGCVPTVAALSNAFRLSRCVADGKLVLVTLRVAGQDYTTIQRRSP